MSLVFLALKHFPILQKKYSSQPDNLVQEEPKLPANTMIPCRFFTTPSSNSDTDNLSEASLEARCDIGHERQPPLQKGVLKYNLGGM